MARETQVKYVVVTKGGDAADGFNGLAEAAGFSGDLLVDTIEEVVQQVVEEPKGPTPSYVRVTFEYFDTAEEAAGSQSVG